MCKLIGLHFFNLGRNKPIVVFKLPECMTCYLKIIKSLSDANEELLSEALKLDYENGL